MSLSANGKHAVQFELKKSESSFYTATLLEKHRVNPKNQDWTEKVQYSVENLDCQFLDEDPFGVNCKNLEMESAIVPYYNPKTRTTQQEIWYDIAFYDDNQNLASGVYFPPGTCTRY